MADVILRASNTANDREVAAATAAFWKAVYVKEAEEEAMAEVAVAAKAAAKDAPVAFAKAAALLSVLPWGQAGAWFVSATSGWPTNHGSRTLHQQGRRVATLLDNGAVLLHDPVEEESAFRNRKAENRAEAARYEDRLQAVAELLRFRYSDEELEAGLEACFPSWLEEARPLALIGFRTDEGQCGGAFTRLAQDGWDAWRVSAPGAIRRALKMWPGDRAVPAPVIPLKQNLRFEAESF